MVRPQPLLAIGRHDVVHVAAMVFQRHVDAAALDGFLEVPVRGARVFHGGMRGVRLEALREGQVAHGCRVLIGRVLRLHHHHLPLAQLHALAGRFLVQVHDGARLAGEEGPGGGEPHLLRLGHHQLRAQFALDLAQVLAQGRLRGEQLLCRLGDVEALREMHEFLQVFDAHGHPLVTVRFERVRAEGHDTPAPPAPNRQCANERGANARCTGASGAGASCVLQDRPPGASCRTAPIHLSASSLASAPKME